MTGLIWLGVRFNQNLRQLIFIFFDLPTNIEIITIFLIFFFFAKLQLYFIVIILMKMYHIAIVPSNYPIFFAVHCGYTPPSSIFNLLTTYMHNHKVHVLCCIQYGLRCCDRYKGCLKFVGNSSFSFDIYFPWISTPYGLLRTMIREFWGTLSFVCAFYKTKTICKNILFISSI